jgi:tetratricopeptide (TPR) repeat protein
MRRRPLVWICLLALGLASLPSVAAARPADGNTTTAEQRAQARALAYYHFTLGHHYEELAGPFRRSAYLRQAIEEYKQALKHDPESTEIVMQLAEAYRTSGGIREAVLEARQLVENDPNNLAAHRLLGRIYFQTLGELDPSTPPKQTLRLAIEEYQHIARLAPDDTESLITLARLHRMNNDTASAEAILKRVLAQEPASEVALASLASIYTDRGEYEKATKLLEDSTQGATSGSVLAALAFSYEQNGELEQAIDTYRRALKLESDNREFRRRLAETLLRAERYEEALVEYQVLVEANPEDADALLRLSQIYRHQGRYEEARQALEKAKAAAPDDLEIGFNEAILYEDEGNFDGAIAVLSAMVTRMTRASGEYTVQEKRSRSIVLERLGSTYRRMENFDQAVKAFEQMLPLEEESAQRGYAQLAETYRQARQYEKGIATLRQALERFPEGRDLTLQLATMLSESGNLEQGVESARSLLSGTAEDRPVYLALAQVYERHKKWPEAEAALDAAEELSTTEGELEYVYFLRGAVYERQKQYDRAEEQFRLVLELNPDSAITLNYLGYMFADQNMKLEESVELLKRAIELEPHNGAYLDSLGWAYYRLGRLELAEDYLLQAIERLSHDPTIQSHLGDVYYETGRLHLAEKAWERAREEWQRTSPTEFDAEAFAQLEEKLKQLKLRLAQEMQKKAKE